MHVVSFNHQILYLNGKEGKEEEMSVLNRLYQDFSPSDDNTAPISLLELAIYDSEQGNGSCR